MVLDNSIKKIAIILVFLFSLSLVSSETLIYNMPDLSSSNTQSSNIKSMYHDGFDATLYFLAPKGEHTTLSGDGDPVIVPADFEFDVYRPEIANELEIARDYEIIRAEDYDSYCSSANSSSTEVEDEGDITYTFDQEDIVSIRPYKKSSKIQSCGADISLEYAAENPDYKSTNWNRLNLNQYNLFNLQDNLSVRVHFESEDGRTPVLVDDLDIEVITLKDIMDIDEIEVEEGELFQVDVLNYLNRDFAGFLMSFRDNLNISLENSDSLECTEIGDYIFECYVPQVNSEYTGNILFDVSLSEDRANINIPVDLPYVVADSIEVDFSKVNLEMFKNSEIEIDLTDYVDGAFPQNYYFDLGSYNSSIADCSINEDILECESYNESGNISIPVSLFIGSIEIESQINLDVVDTPEPVFSDFTMSFDADIGATEDLMDHVSNLQYEDYSFEIGEFDSLLADCSISNDTLSCLGLGKIGEDNFDISLVYPEGEVVASVSLEVTTNSPVPIAIQDFTNKTYLNSSFEYNLDEYFSDDGELSYQVNYDRTALDCSVLDSTLSCSFIEDVAESNIEVNAYDIYAQEVSQEFVVNIFSEGNLVSNISTPSGTTFMTIPTDVDFNLEYSLINTHGYDLYDIEITPQINYDNSSIVLVDYPSIDLPEIIDSDYSLELPINISVIESSIGEEFNLSIITLGTQKNVNLDIIPITSEEANSYLDVDVYIPGERVDGHDNYIPNGVKVAVPFRVSNYFDVPITTNICKGLTGVDFGDIRKFYTKDSENYIEESSGIECSEVTINGTYEDEIYIESKQYGGLGSTFRTFAFLDTNPTINNSSDYLDYIETSNSLISTDALMLINSYDYDSDIFFLGGSVTSPTSGATLNRNTNYIANVRFTNNYAFDIVDVHGCFKIRVVYSADNIEFVENSSVFEITSDSCKNIDRIDNGEETNIYNYNFRTKNLSYDGTTTPGYAFSLGYLLESEFERRGNSWYIVN